VKAWSTMGAPRKWASCCFLQDREEWPGCGPCRENTAPVIFAVYRGEEREVAFFKNKFSVAAA